MPFDIWQPNAETIAAMEEDLSKTKSFRSVKDLMADLNADD
ncbi:DNA-damage-inducible protein J [Acinetobacter gerneri DSM 14967 = CIP 107464 = MTCC 9824]|nr:DNA-damage-inducible protein J [Acinetobacter gerneri DSM 14967 = CIP 107464 = MTCC 9824]